VQHLDPDDLFTVTKQGFDFYHRVFGYRYPFGKYDQLFVPEFNAGAMGERRRRHLPRGLRLPLQGHRRGVRAAGRDGAARDGPHVVRRPRDHALVGRPVAQRVLRTYMSVLCQVEATEYTRGWTTFANTEKTWAYRRTSCRRPTRSPPTSPTSTR
jgi:aminopeptidase N